MGETFTQGKEKRWSKRIGIDAKIKLKSIKNNKTVYAVNEDEISVEVINISKGGMAFKSEEQLPLNSYYDADVVLWTKETFGAVIEIVRMENADDEDKITYGCKFIGLSAADQFKIDVYQIVSEA